MSYRSPLRGLLARIAGPLACLALLFYGAVSLSKPQHSYFLVFSLGGETQDALDASLRLDDGLLRAPIKIVRADRTLGLVALPVRTIRGIALGPAASATTITDPRIVRATGMFRAPTGPDESTPIYRRLTIAPGATRASVTLDLTEPLTLLRDTQVAWAWRCLVVLAAGVLVLWLANSQRRRLSASRAARLRELLEGRKARATMCALWAAATFSVYFVAAGRVASFDWNIIEFIIANHLQDFGRYALGATYPAAIWRPVGPTFLVLAVDAIVRDPLLTYQLLTAAAVTSFVVSAFLLNRMLFGNLLANVGAALAFATPALINALIYHSHSISHLCFLLVASPALLASVTGLLALRDSRPGAPRWLWAASIGWSLCYLCRPESMVMAFLFCGAVAALIVRHRRSFRMLAPLAPFAIVFIGFNVWADVAAARGDLLSRKVIYQYYASQGWTELADIKRRSPDGDIEQLGYRRAIELYGTPQENSESLSKAIARNPRALAERIKSNLLALAELLFKGRFLSPDVLLLLLALPLALFWMERRLWLPAIFCASVFSVIGIFLIFHIDDRYVTIALPAAVLLASFSAHGLDRLPLPDRFGRTAFAGIVLAIAMLRLPFHGAALANAGAQQRLDLSSVRAIAAGFRSVVPAGEQAIVHLDVPLPPALASSATLLFPYFARTGLSWPAPNDAYPRDRLFALPPCPATYAVVLDTAANRPAGAKLGTYAVSGIGMLAVYRLPTGAKPAGRFC